MKHRATLCFAKIENEFKKHNDPLLRNLGNLTFADSRDIAPIQAADLLAYEMYRYGKSRGDDAKAPMREEAVRALIRFKELEDFWLFDAVRFKKLAQSMDAVR